MSPKKDQAIASAMVVLLMSAGCVTSSDLRRLEQDTNVRQEQLRRELNLVRESITRLQNQIEHDQNTPAVQRLERQTQNMRDAILLMGQAVTTIGQQLSATEENKSKVQ